MKIGLVLFGHLRSYRQALSSFNLLIETLRQSGEVDVFCHTWNIEESVTASWWKDNNADNPPPATVTNKQIEDSFHAVRYIIEPSRQFDDSGFDIQTSIPIAGILSMLHSQFEAFRLLKEYEVTQSFQYDIILKTRYDLLYEIAPGFNKLVNECVNNKTVYVPSSNPYEIIGSVSDIFAIGNRSSIEKYFSFCNNFKAAVSYYKERGYRQFLPELCMTDYLKRIGVQIDELTGLRLHILRMNGDKFQINSDKNFTENGPLCFYSGTIELGSKILAPGSNVINENSGRLVKKYMKWIDEEAGTEQLESYTDFYSGKWMEESKIKSLAKKTKENQIFAPNVMKNFFEAAMRKGNYGSIKKSILAFILYVHSRYGLFFFRVLRNVAFNRK